MNDNIIVLKERCYSNACWSNANLESWCLMIVKGEKMYLEDFINQILSIPKFDKK